MSYDPTLINILTNAFETSGYIIVDSTFCEEIGMHRFILKSNLTITIYAIIRKVSKSGWSDKKHIRRVQVTKIETDKLDCTNYSQTFMIIGLESIFEEDIFVAWNIYRYGSHEKNRSCYVNAMSLFKTFLDGYYTTTDANQKIWLSDKKNLNKLLYDYIKFNMVTTEESN